MIKSFIDFVFKIVLNENNTSGQATSEYVYFRYNTKTTVKYLIDLKK